MESATYLGGGFRDQGLEQGTHPHFIGLGLVFGGASHRSEGTFVALAVIDLTNIFERSFDKSYGEPPVIAVALDILDPHLIEARCQCLDRLQYGSNFPVFSIGDLRGHKDAEMADLIVGHIDNTLAAHPDLGYIRMGLHNPVQRLLRWRDVVPVTGEDDDWCPNHLQVNRPSRFNAGFVLDQPVANKELLHDPADFWFGHQEETAPSFLEFEEALVPLVDIAIEIDIFPEKCSRGV